MVGLLQKQVFLRPPFTSREKQGIGGSNEGKGGGKVKTLKSYVNLSLLFRPLGLFEVFIVLD